MSWPGDTARAAIEAFDGSFGDKVVVATAALEAAETVTALSRCCPADARFEIGSVTKTVTATLLASIADEGLVGLDDEIGRWLAAGPNGSVTLRELATHTSGLPRLAPDRVTGQLDMANPYASVTPDIAEEGLRRAARTPGGGFGYSNFGFQLLGLVLERATGASYQALLSDRLLNPLSMTFSGVGAAGGGSRLSGYVFGGQVAHWDQPLPGAGGIEATINDLAEFLRVCLFPPRTALGDAVRLAQTAQVRVGVRQQVGLGWMIRDGRIVWHNGRTGGFCASVGIDRLRRRAVAILLNTSEASGAIDDAVLRAVDRGDPREPRPHGTGGDSA